MAGVSAIKKEEARKCRHREEGGGEGKNGRTGVAAAGDMSRRYRVLDRGEEAGSKREREKKHGVGRRCGRERNGGGSDGDNAAAGGTVESAGEQCTGGICEDDETGVTDEVEGGKPEEKGRR